MPLHHASESASLVQILRSVDGGGSSGEGLRVVLVIVLVIVVMGPDNFRDEALLEQIILLV